MENMCPLIANPTVIQSLFLPSAVLRHVPDYPYPSITLAVSSSAPPLEISGAFLNQRPRTRIAFAPPRHPAHQLLHNVLADAWRPRGPSLTLQEDAGGTCLVQASFSSVNIFTGLKWGGAAGSCAGHVFTIKLSVSEHVLPQRC